MGALPSGAVSTTVSYTSARTTSSAFCDLCSGAGEPLFHGSNGPLVAPVPPLALGFDRKGASAFWNSL